MMGQMALTVRASSEYLARVLVLFVLNNMATYDEYVVRAMTLDIMDLTL